MSLLDGGADYEPVVVYPEVLVTDMDGNPRTQPSTIGIAARARFQIANQSGTASRRAEQDNEGFESEKVYNVRFPRSFTTVLGAQSVIEWRGEKWNLFGDPNRYHGSSRTRRLEYTVRRS